jgi:hypothetical protein
MLGRVSIIAAAVCLMVPPLGAQTSSSSGSTRRITCGSLTVNQVRCSTEGPADSVRLVQQASFANCRQGSNWGYTDSLIWAGNGCRAEFEVTYRAASSGLPESPVGPTSTPASTPASAGTSITRIVTCGSTTSAEARCNLGAEVTRVRLARDLSGTRCREGYSWGRSGTVVWTNKGCRAQFAVTYSSGTPAQSPPAATPADSPTTSSGTRVLTCGDTSGSAMSCNTFGTVATVRLRRDRSAGRCDRPNWGLSGESIWVADGCYGDFELAYASPSEQERGIR